MSVEFAYCKTLFFRGYHISGFRPDGHIRGYLISGFCGGKREHFKLNGHFFVFLNELVHCVVISTSMPTVLFGGRHRVIVKSALLV